MIILNDLHLGCVRRGGVTPSSQEDLRTYIFEQFNALLEKANGHDLCLLGDIFDDFEVSPRDWLETYMLLAAWCANNLDCTLDLVAGNHDVSSKGSKVSSFETLSTVLSQQFDNVNVIGINGSESAFLDAGKVFTVAHHANQDLFDITLNEILEGVQPGDFVLLHANYHNKWAEQADHSLNVSEDTALKFTEKGVNLVFAHEHQSRTEIPHGTPAHGGTVVCLGCQIPTSISDCLGNRSKYFWTLEHGSLTKTECWVAEGSYAELDWRNLGQDAQFIRVVGDAVNAEAAQVIDAIHRFRQKSNAFVITNAVKIEGIADIESLPEAFEASRKFDVMEFVYGQLNEAEAEVIRKISANLEP